MFLDIQALPQDIQVLITKREEARKEKNWNESDLLREQLSALGYTIHDAPEGAKVTKQ
jgi:cysteinyl-tRNA synthetase